MKAVMSDIEGQRSRDFEASILSLFDYGSAAVSEMESIDKCLSRAAIECEHLLVTLAGIKAHFSIASVTMDTLDSLLRRHPKSVITQFSSRQCNSTLFVVIDYRILNKSLEAIFCRSIVSEEFDSNSATSELGWDLAEALASAVVRGIEGEITSDRKFGLRLQDITAAADKFWDRPDHPNVLISQLSCEQLGESSIFIAIPDVLVRAMRSKPTMGFDDSGFGDDPNWSADLRSRVLETEVEVVAEIEARGFTVGQIGDLANGTTLELDQKLLEDVTLQSGDVPLFRAALGQSDGSYTVLVTEPVLVAET